MMPKTLIVLTGVALAAGIGAASAGEPMQLTAAQMDRITAGAGEGGFNFKVLKEFNVKKKHELEATLATLTRALGNLAQAEAAAEAEGFNSFTDTHSITLAKEGGHSTSLSESVSAASPFWEANQVDLDSRSSSGGGNGQ